MFGFRKKEKSREELLAVVDGTLIPIEDVKDPVFSQKMMGDGFAIASTGDTIYACADADITMLFPSNHAVGLTLKNGMEILIHVGIDTVNENGNGFTCLCEQGKAVEKGEPLLKMDRDY
ncbi:MAG: PTS glucose transporter subunit IIA, partial [[Clostridium] innocuum]